MNGFTWTVSVTLACAALAGCGSSTSTTKTHQTGTQTSAAAIAGHDLARLNRPLPVTTTPLPTPSTKPVVEREYLTRLFDDAQNAWRREFAAAGLVYTSARLVIYWSKTQSACGKADESGPFYCPGSRGTVYLDLQFFTRLMNRFGVNGIAQAYILGHEMGHHIQTLLGVGKRVDAANQADPSGRNGRSVLVELEADCLAGVWGRAAYSRAGLMDSDLQEARKAAEVIGDDYEARAAGELVDSSLWTHGSSQQRQSWLRTGFRSGRPVACDTFANAERTGHAKASASGS